MPNKDYDNFVARMGSFDDNFDDIFEGIDLNSHIKGASHMDDNQRALSHFGVPGMKCGVRKAASAAGRYAKEAGKLTKNSYVHPILTTKAASASISKDKLGTRLRRTTIANTTKELADINQRVDKAVQQRAQQKAAKKQAKAKAKVEKILAKKEAEQKVKDLKQNYEKEYMAGKSKVGKIISGVTGAHTIYADVMYDLNDAKR